jgi:UDP-N-acetylmuramate dehydrogenase
MIPSEARAALREALGDVVRFNVPMKRHVSLRVGGPTDALVTPTHRGELARALGVCAAHAIPHTILGAGFNTFARDGGVDGVVLQMRRMRAIELRPDGTLRAECGVSHATLTKFCIEHGRSGLEFGAGIPGTVGGWLAMNAGIGDREVKDVVLAIDLMRADGSEVVTIPRAELQFEYRALRGLEPGSVIVAAVFETTASTPETVQAEVDRLLAHRRATQPLDVPSCGSVFKNPEGDHAGRLIEAAGLKGRALGGAEISPVHANFIANRGDASAADVLGLIELAHDAVLAGAGIELETEVRIVGREAAPTVRSEGRDRSGGAGRSGRPSGRGGRR